MHSETYNVVTFYVQCLLTFLLMTRFYVSTYTGHITGHFGAESASEGALPPVPIPPVPITRGSAPDPHFGLAVPAAGV